MTEDETVGWHHQFIAHELGQTLGDGEGCMKTLWQDCAFSLGRVRHREKAEGPDGKA